MPQDDDDTACRVIGLVADPGLPADVVSGLVDDLPALLAQHVSDRVGWKVEQHHSELRLNDQGFIPLITLAKEQPGHGEWDFVVYLTDLPRRSGNASILADISISHASALISLPALGGFRVRHRAATTVIHAVRRLLANHTDELPPQRGVATPAAPSLARRPGPSNRRRHR